MATARKLIIIKRNCVFLYISFSEEPGNPQQVEEQILWVFVIIKWETWAAYM